MFCLINRQKKMTKYLQSNATSKKGINHIKRVIKSVNCEFHTIHQENDIGLDAIIELNENTGKKGRLVAVQVKSGKSFYTVKTGKCKIDISEHREYWLNHDLDVYGIVFIPELFKAFYVDIKSYLIENPKRTVITFSSAPENEFNFENFNNSINNYRPRSLEQIKLYQRFISSIENKMIKIFFNSINISVNLIIEKIMVSSSFQELLIKLGCNLVSAEERDKIKEEIGMQQCSSKEGSFMYSINRDIYLRNPSLKFYENKFQTLKVIIRG